VVILEGDAVPGFPQSLVDCSEGLLTLCLRFLLICSGQLVGWLVSMMGKGQESGSLNALIIIRESLEGLEKLLPS